VVYEINLETESKKRCRMQPRIVTKERRLIDTGHGSNRTKAKWVKKDISRGQCFRFEWK
jgi:hypothetical protein